MFEDCWLALNSEQQLLCSSMDLADVTHTTRRKDTSNSTILIVVKGSAIFKPI